VGLGGLTTARLCGRLRGTKTKVPGTALQRRPAPGGYAAARREAGACPIPLARR
jgi:hypothetical protein